MEDQNILEMPRDPLTIIESPQETFDEFQHRGQKCPDAPKYKRIEYDLETIRKRLFKMERECDAQSASLLPTIDEDFNSCCNI